MFSELSPKRKKWICRISGFCGDQAVEISACYLHFFPIYAENAREFSKENQDTGNLELGLWPMGYGYGTGQENSKDKEFLVDITHCLSI